MTNVSSYSLTSVYEEDIPVVAPGVELVGHPCVIWSVIVTVEPAQVVVVSFSNSKTAYDNSVRCGKITISGPGTQQVVFPKGLPATTGLCAIANNGSADVMVEYE